MITLQSFSTRLHRGLAVGLWLALAGVPSCTAILDSYGLPTTFKESPAQRRAVTDASLLSAEAYCLGGAGKTEVAIPKLEAFLAATRKALPPEDEILLSSEILVATWYSVELGRHAEAARRIEAAVTAYENAHPGQHGMSVVTTLSSAYWTLTVVQSEAHEREASERSYARHRQYQQAMDQASARLVASVPASGRGGLQGAMQAQADIAAWNDRMYQVEAGQGEGLRLQLEQAGSLSILEDQLLFQVEMAAGSPQAALEALERGGEAAAVDLGSPERLRGYSASSYSQIELFSRMFETSALTMATTASSPPRSDEVAFWLAEQRKGRFFDAMVLAPEPGVELAPVLSDIRLARAARAAEFLRGLGDDTFDPLRDCEKMARRPALADDKDPMIKAVRQAENRLSPHPAPPTGLVTFWKGVPKETTPQGSSAAFLRAVRAHLPKGHSALVSYVRFEATPPWDLKDFWAARPVTARYAAFVVGAKGLALVDLGLADEIDRLTDAVVKRPAARPAAGESPGDETMALWQRLYDRVWRPLAPHLEGTSQVIVAADGSLDRVPFAALHDGHHWLYERHTLSEVHSARDLVDDKELRGAGGPPLVLANPVAPPAPGGSSLLASTHFQPLAGAEDEARAVQKLLPGSVLRVGPQADEATLLAGAAPAILHVASHAVFLPKNAGAVDDPGVRGLRVVAPQSMIASGSDAFALPYLNLDEGWMRSALVLSAPPSAAAAGNAGGLSAPWDGFATAYEIMAMDLHGTQLVILSACETGVGQAVRHHGVNSLQRAFMNAGAESVIASLWQIDDESTVIWMEELYRGLLAGHSRVEAMRAAMSAVRARYPHPFHWAAFTLLGAPGPLRSFEGTPIAAPRARR
jgi:CHAT domain-containing protein